MKRSVTRRRTDRRIFRQTADKSRLINLKPVFMRGGIRL